MQLYVCRDSCCAQDDQIGPLDGYFEFHDHISFEHVIQHLLNISFFPHTATHNHIIGKTGKHNVVEILLPNDKIFYHVLKNRFAKNIIQNNSLYFEYTYLRYPR